MPDKMPAPGSRDAPKFEKEKPAELIRFISRMEDLYKKCGIDSEEERVVTLGKYADAKSEKQWKYLNAYKLLDWKKFVEELKGSYTEAMDDQLGSIKELKRICRSYQDIRSNDLAELQEFKLAFIAEAKSLQEPPAVLSNREAVDFFLDALSDEFRDKVINRLDILAAANSTAGEQTTRRVEDKYDLDQAVEIALSIAKGARANLSVRPSGKSSGGEGSRAKNNDDYNTPEKRKAALNEAMSSTVKSEEVVQTISSLIDEIRTSRKQTESSQKGMMDGMVKALQQMMPRQAPTMPVSNSQSNYRPATYAVNNISNGCFYCGEPEHRRDACPHRQRHIEIGWIIMDAMGRTRLVDGRPIPLTGGTTAKERVEAICQKKPAQSGQGPNNTPGIIQLSQIVSSGPLTQERIEEMLDNIDPDDVVQYLISRDKIAINSEEGF